MTLAACSFSTRTPSVVDDASGAEEVIADASIDAAVRTNRALIALYTFSEGSGLTVHDTSGAGSPLELEIPGGAPVTWGAGTLTVTGDTLIASPIAATKILDAIRAADAFTLEAWITPSMIGGYFPRVVTLSQTNASLAVSLLAIDDHFEFRMLGPQTDTNGLPSLNTAAATVKLARMHVVLVTEPGGTRTIYVDGVPVIADTLGGDLASWGTSHRLGLANEIDGGRSWVGTFDRVAIYATALTKSEVEGNFAVGP